MKLKTIITFAAFLALSGGAFGQVYMGAGVLQGKMSVPSVSTTLNGAAFTGAGNETTATGFKLYGGYDFTSNWGVEVGYNDLGNNYSLRGSSGATPWSSGGGHAHSWYVAGVGTLPLSKGLSIFAKLGLTANRIADGWTVTAAGSNMNVGFQSVIEPIYGAGASYAFNKNWAARLEYEDYNKFSGKDFWGTSSGTNFTNTGTARASAWSLSARYSF
jgi:OOP family OmpA-OmpF porin